MNSSEIPKWWKRKPIKNIPIQYKLIKGNEYAFQVIRSWRDPATGKVVKEERYLGARKPARQKPIMDVLDNDDLDIITEAWQRGEDVAWIQLYVEIVTHDKPSPATVYNWFRAKGIKRGKRTTKRAEKKRTAEDERIERARQLKLEEKGLRARQAKRRVAARKEIDKLKKKDYSFSRYLLSYGKDVSFQEAEIGGGVINLWGRAERKKEIILDTLTRKYGKEYQFTPDFFAGLNRIEFRRGG